MNNTKTLIIGSLVLVLIIMGAAFWGAVSQEVMFRLRFSVLGRNEQGYLEYVDNKSGIQFVLIPPTTFTMGATEDEILNYIRENEAFQDTLETACQSGETYCRKMQVPGFMIGKYEVKQSEWKKIMGYNHARHKNDQGPVEMVTWNECRSFCVNAGLSLPSEAQWELACKGNSGLRKPSSSETVVQSKPGTPQESQHCNAFGLVDMDRGVIEWCDGPLFSGGLEVAPLRGFQNIVTNRTGRWEVVRLTPMRSTARGELSVDKCDHDIGFRVVLNMGGSIARP